MKFGKRFGFALAACAGAGLTLGVSAAFAGGDKHHKGMAHIKAMDTNADGKLSQEEHTAGARKMFEAMDGNKDGKVTTEEMDAARPQVAGKPARPDGKTSAEKMKVVDTNLDGVLTADEHAAGAKMMFETMDADKDGMLSKAEFKAGHKMLKKDPTKDAAKPATK